MIFVAFLVMYLFRVKNPNNKYKKKKKKMEEQLWAQEI